MPWSTKASPKQNLPRDRTQTHAGYSTSPPKPIGYRSWTPYYGSAMPSDSTFSAFWSMQRSDRAAMSSQFPVPSSQFPGPQATEQQRLLLDLKPLHIAKALKTLRLEHGLSQRRLHTLTQFSIYSISLREGERYQNYPTITTLKLYCDAFHIHLSSLVGRALSYV